MSVAYFVSDLHLSGTSDPKTKVFVEFLDSISSAGALGPAATHLFLVGDVFDLWIGSHAYFKQAYPEVIEAIARLVRQGVEVHFFEGNHDLFLKPFWETELGVSVHPDAATFELNGKVVRVEHGDLINPDDKGYLFLRAFLRTSGMRWLALNLPSKAVAAIGERSSRASREYTSSAKKLPEERIRTLIRAHAKNCLESSNFDLIVTGHVHVLDDVEIRAANRVARSINLGSWYDGPKVFVLSKAGGQFVKLPAEPTSRA